MRSEFQVQRKPHFQKTFQTFFLPSIPFSSTLGLKNMHIPGISNIFSNLQIKSWECWRAASLPYTSKERWLCISLFKLRWLWQKLQMHIWQLDATALTIINIDFWGRESKSNYCQISYKRKTVSLTIWTALFRPWMKSSLRLEAGQFAHLYEASCHVSLY